MGALKLAMGMPADGWNKLKLVSEAMQTDHGHIEIAHAGHMEPTAPKGLASKMFSKLRG
jgi:hypothetical protein